MAMVRGSFAALLFRVFFSNFVAKARRANESRAMGGCLSCLQDDTRRADKAHIVPMGQEFSHYEVRPTPSHTHTPFSHALLTHTGRLH